MSVERTLYLFGLFVVFLIFLSGCKSSPKGTGDESLVEARIQSAVNAERARWTKELSSDIERGLSEIDQRVTNVGAGLSSIRAAVEEYRRFVLTIIDRLQQSETDVRTDAEVDGKADSGISRLDTVKGIAYFDRS